MKKLTPIFFTLLMATLFSCNNAPSNPDSNRTSETQNAAVDSTVQFLLNASAKDFHDHQPPTPVSFRNVEVRNLIGSNATNHYMLCGQFLGKENQSKDEWTSFATIKTSGYEQWIGDQSLTYCRDSKEVTYKTNDLSSALKSLVDSLNNVQPLTK